MKAFITILSLLLTLLATAQQDLTIRVKRLPGLTIDPDSMYFNSHVARTFTIHMIPPGAKLRVQFTGGDLAIGDSTITLIPFSVYRDSAVINLQSRMITGFKTTKGNFYTADLHVTAVDATGAVRARMDRPCYIASQPPPRYIPLLSTTSDPIFFKAIRDTIAGAK